MDIVSEIGELIINISALLGKPIKADQFIIIDHSFPHHPKALPRGRMGVYIFLYEDEFLKIGKAGPKSTARFLSQHYSPSSSASNLSSSILTDPLMQQYSLSQANVGSWIRENCRRVDVLLDASLGIFALELVEALLHYRYQPRYEGFSTQR